MFSIEHILIGLSLAANVTVALVAYNHAGRLKGIEASLKSTLTKAAGKV
jgi:hypothetical protein